MIARAAFGTLATSGPGPAGVPAPAHAPAHVPAQAPGGGLLPSDPQDFQCFVLVRQPREAFVAKPRLPRATREPRDGFANICATFHSRVPDLLRTRTDTGMGSARAVQFRQPQQQH